jgi:hypothetical protein
MKTMLGPEADEQISSMAMDGDAVWAAAGQYVRKYIRGKEVSASYFSPCYLLLTRLQVLRAENPYDTDLNFITIFGSKLLGLTEDGTKMLMWNTSDGGQSRSQDIVRSETEISSTYQSYNLASLLTLDSLPALYFIQRPMSIRYLYLVFKAPCNCGISTQSQPIYCTESGPSANTRLELAFTSTITPSCWAIARRHLLLQLSSHLLLTL